MLFLVVLVDRGFGVVSGVVMSVEFIVGEVSVVILRDP